MILTFFLSRNLRIARDRAWEQTIVSRGKGPDFWKHYVEEWDSPPPLSRWKGMAHWASTTVGRILIKREFLWGRYKPGSGHVFDLEFVSFLGGRTVMLMPLHLIPVAGIAISAGLRALGTARYLHKSVRAVSLHSAGSVDIDTSVPHTLTSTVLRIQKDDQRADLGIHRGAQMGIPLCVSHIAHRFRSC